MHKSNTPVLVLLALIVAAAVVLGGCGSANEGQSVAAPAATQAETLDLPAEIDAATLDSIRGRDDVYVLDVREDHEYAAGHVPGATLIPLGQLPNRLAEIPTDKTIVAVCRSGNRSGQATQFLSQQGFDVHNMQGGMISWEQAGLQVER